MPDPGWGNGFNIPDVFWKIPDISFPQFGNPCPYWVCQEEISPVVHHERWRAPGISCHVQLDCTWWWQV